SPGAKARETTCPATGDGSSTSALSVCTSTSGWSRATVSPGFTSHETTSPSSRPSPTSGSANSTRAMALGLAADPEGGGDDPGRVGHVVLLQHPHRVGDVVAADPGDRRFQRVEALLADGGHDLGGEARRLRGLVDDDGPAGVP